MHIYDVYQCPEGHTHAGRWSFRIDDQECLMYYPTEYSARRTCDRMREGRSAVFGGPTVGGQPTSAPRAAVRQCGVRRELTRGGKTVERPLFRGCLDGVDTEVSGTEREAREDVAVRAMMTRGKLGRLREVEAALGEPCAVSVSGGRVFAETSDGRRFVVSICPKGGPIEFGEVHADEVVRVLS